MVNTPDKVGLPIRPFLYSPDQIASILGVTEQTVRTAYLYYDKRSIGHPSPNLMMARNIRPDPNDRPDWRVGEKELIRWLKRKGFKIHETSYLRN
jgi:hypothetical protein